MNEQSEGADERLIQKQSKVQTVQNQSWENPKEKTLATQRVWMEQWGMEVHLTHWETVNQYDYYIYKGKLLIVYRWMWQGEAELIKVNNNN